MEALDGCERMSLSLAPTMPHATHFSPPCHTKTLEWAFAMVEALISSYRLDEADSTHHHRDLRRGVRNAEFVSNNATFAFKVMHLCDPERHL